MKWTASTTVFRTEPRHGTTHSFPGIEADSELDAARSAANMAAQYFYHDMGTTSGFLNEVAPHLFRASIGNYVNGVTIGHTVEILLWRDK